VAPGIWYNGFVSRKSFGGSSYFVEHRDGNWMIDSPRYVEHLVKRFAEMGGVRYIFLTHRDDVADADRYAARFGATRIIHRLELGAQPDAERVIDGSEALELAPGFLAIPTPGHTAGHCALLPRWPLPVRGRSFVVEPRARPAERVARCVLVQLAPAGGVNPAADGV